MKHLRVSRHLIPAHTGFPNASINPDRPLLIYHSCSPPSASASAVERHLRSVGVAEPQWQFAMYKQHQYHSTTNEVLVVVEGSAKLCFGGGDNPSQAVHEAGIGDVIVVPAGVAHAMLEDHGDFSMVGSYPVGAEQWDHCVGSEGEVARKRIGAIGWFKKDPVYGQEGPCLATT